MTRPAGGGTVSGVQGRTLAVATTAAVLAFSATAQAGLQGPTESLGTSKGLEYWRGKMTDVQTQAQQGANCDGDSEVTGGGGSVSGPHALVEVNETYPQESPASWQAEGSAEEGGTLTAYAICAGVDLNYPAGSEMADFPGPWAGSGHCDSGERPTGAGVGSAMAGLGINGLLPVAHPDPSTLVQVQAPSTGFIYFPAACWPNGDQIRYRDGSKLKIAPGAAGKAIAKCRENEAVAGGGVSAQDRGNAIDDGFKGATWLNASRPWDSKADNGRAPDDGWLVKVHNHDAPKMDLFARAACLRPGDA